MCFRGGLSSNIVAVLEAEGENRKRVGIFQGTANLEQRRLLILNGCGFSL